MMKQPRRIMFVNSSQPLIEVPVRLVCNNGETEHEMVTDGDGQVFCELEEGKHTAKVHAKDAWIDCTFMVSGKQSLFVVDVNTHASGAFNQITGSFSGLRNQVFGDRYVFEEVIGRGGMGVVVRATDKLLNRTVAIKMLNDEFLDNQEAQQIFLEEARSIATLTHPNLVGIFDVTMLEGRAMIVFEYIEGEDLDTVFAEHGRLSEAGVLRIAIQLTRALKYLHSQGILHRDIKPSNVLMQPDGMLKIIDFGLARPLEQLALKGTRVRGTPAYMAPEQVEGAQLIAATDIYQLGVSLYEVLTGSLPFSSGNMAYSHVHLDPPRIEESVELHDTRLADLIHACLFKLPEDRPSAQVLFQSFQALYATNASYYDGLSDAIIANQDALFSETVELSIPEFRPSTQRTNMPSQPTLDHLPAHMTNRFTTGSSPALDVPHFDDDETTGGQRLVVIAAGLVLLLFGLGSVILMLLNEPKDTRDQDVIGEVSSRESTREPATPPSVESPPPAVDAVSAKPVSEEVDEPTTDDAPEEDVPVAGAIEPTKEAPAAKDPVKKSSPKKATASTLEKTSSKSSASAKKEEPPSTEPVAVVEDAPPVNEKVVATTPAPAEPAKQEPAAQESEEKPTTTRRVIRKKIIRKVVKKKSNPSSKETEKEEDDPQRAPVSF